MRQKCRVCREVTERRQRKRERSPWRLNICPDMKYLLSTLMTIYHWLSAATIRPACPPPVCTPYHGSPSRRVCSMPQHHHHHFRTRKITYLFTKNILYTLGIGFALCEGNALLLSMWTHPARKVLQPRPTMHG